MRQDSLGHAAVENKALYFSFSNCVCNADGSSHLGHLGAPAGERALRVSTAEEMEDGKWSTGWKVAYVTSAHFGQSKSQGSA